MSAFDDDPLDRLLFRREVMKRLARIELFAGAIFMMAVVIPLLKYYGWWPWGP